MKKHKNKEKNQWWETLRPPTQLPPPGPGLPIVTPHAPPGPQLPIVTPHAPPGPGR